MGWGGGGFLTSPFPSLPKTMLIKLMLMGMSAIRSILIYASLVYIVIFLKSRSLHVNNIITLPNSMNYRFMIRLIRSS